MSGPSVPEESQDQKDIEKSNAEQLKAQKLKAQNEQLDTLDRLRGQADSVSGSGTPSPVSPPTGMSGLFGGDTTIG